MRKKKIRELSPIVGVSVKKHIKSLPPHLVKLVRPIRRQKKLGTRPRPSKTLIDQSEILTPEIRTALLDKVAELADERVWGRQEMCKQFAILLQRSLQYFDIEARSVIGKASYPNGFEWEHSWVETESELIDGNSDSMIENPAIPPGMKLRPFWGSKLSVPEDRSFELDENKLPEWDPDVEDVWWPELQEWLKEKYPKH